jgi:hypothetical protein
VGSGSLTDAGSAYFFKRTPSTPTIESKALKTLIAYPSVTSSFLTVETAEIADYQVFNLLGQQVLSGKIPTLEAMRIDVSALSQGTYILKIGLEQAKFVKQ